MADRNFSRMTMVELNRLNPSDLSDEELEQAADRYEQLNSTETRMREGERSGQVIDRRTGAPPSTRFALGAAPPSGRIPTAERLLPGPVIPLPDNNMLYMNPDTDMPTLAVPPDAPAFSAGNMASIIPEAATMAGGIAGMIPRYGPVARAVERTAAPVLRTMFGPRGRQFAETTGRVAARMPGTGVGAAIGNAGAEYAAREEGMVDPRPTREQVMDAGQIALENAALYPVGEAGMAALSGAARQGVRLFGRTGGREALESAENLGIRPTAGMTGNRFVQAIERQSAGLPGSGVTRGAAREAEEGIQRSVTNVADALDPGNIAITPAMARDEVTTRIAAAGGTARGSDPMQAYDLIMRSNDLAPRAVSAARRELVLTDPEAWNLTVAAKLRSLGQPGTGEWSASEFVRGVDELNRTGALQRLLRGTPHASLAVDLPRVADLARRIEGTATRDNPAGIWNAVRLGAIFGSPAAVGAMIAGDMQHVVDQGNLYTALGGGAVVGAAVASRVLQSPAFVRWLAGVPSNPNVSARQIHTHMLQLGNIISQTSDPAQRTALQEYARTMIEGARAAGLPVPMPPGPGQEGAPGRERTGAPGGPAATPIAPTPLPQRRSPGILTRELPAPEETPQ